MRPLLCATTALLALAVVASRSNEQAPVPMVVAATGAIAGSAILGLDDEANSTLRSSPTRALVRLGHRLAVLVSMLLVAVTALVGRRSVALRTGVAAAVTDDVRRARHRWRRNAGRLEPSPT